jgi:hypothetical protein
VNQFVLKVDEESLDLVRHHLGVLGQNLGRQARLVRATPGEITTQMWSGAARDAVCTEITGLGARMDGFEEHFRVADERVRSLRQQVVDAKHRTRTLNRRWEDAVDEQRRAAAAIAFGYTGAAPGVGVTTGRATATDEALVGEQRRLTAEFDDLREELRVAFVGLSGVLASATEVAVSAEVVRSFAAGGPYPVTVGVAEMMAARQPLLARKMAQDDARDAVPLLRAAAAGDLAAAQTLRERFAGRAADPVFAFEVTRLMGAEGMAGLAGGMARQMFAASADPTRLTAVSESNRWMSTFVGTALVTAADGRRYADLPEDYREQVAAWREGTLFPELKAVGRQEFSASLAPGDPTGVDNSFYGYWAISQFVGAAAASGRGPGPEFMASVGADLVSWDRGLNDHAQGRDGGWAGPSTGSPGGGGSAVSALTLDRTGTAQDPVTGLLAAAALDPRSGRALLLADVDPGAGRRSALEYLVGDRHEGLSTNPYADGGKLLGRAVVVADHDRSSEPAVQVATQFLNTYMQGLVDHGPTGGTGGQARFGLMFADMRGSVATVLAYHIDDVQPAVGDNQVLVRETSPGNHGEYDVQFGEPQQLATLFADLAADRPDDIGDLDGANPNALQVVLRAQLTYSAEYLHDVAEDGKAVSAGSAKTSKVMSYMLKGAEIGLTKMGDEDGAAGLRLRDFLARGAALVPVGKIPGVGQAAGAAYDKATEYLLDRTLPDDAREVQQRRILAYEDVCEKLMRDQVDVAITEAGKWPDDVSPKVWLEALKYPAESRFYTDDGEVMPRNKMTPDQRHAFTNWRYDVVNGAGGIYGPAMDEAGQNNLVGDKRAEGDYNAHHVGDNAYDTE